MGTSCRNNNVSRILTRFPRDCCVTTPIFTTSTTKSRPQTKTPRKSSGVTPARTTTPFAQLSPRYFPTDTTRHPSAARHVLQPPDRDRCCHLTPCGATLNQITYAGRPRRHGTRVREIRSENVINKFEIHIWNCTFGDRHGRYFGGVCFARVK